MCVSFEFKESTNLNSVPLPPSSRPPLADSWYSLSYLYFSPIGTIVAVSVGLVVSLLTGTQYMLLFTFF